MRILISPSPSEVSRLPLQKKLLPCGDIAPLSFYVYVRASLLMPEAEHAKPAMPQNAGTHAIWTGLRLLIHHLEDDHALVWRLLLRQDEAFRLEVADPAKDPVAEGPLATSTTRNSKCEQSTIFLRTIAPITAQPCAGKLFDNDNLCNPADIGRNQNLKRLLASDICDGRKSQTATIRV